VVPSSTYSNTFDFTSGRPANEIQNPHPAIAAKRRMVNHDLPAYQADESRVSQGNL